jgi:hypothetical protein
MIIIIIFMILVLFFDCALIITSETRVVYLGIFFIICFFYITSFRGGRGGGCLVLIRIIVDRSVAWIGPRYGLIIIIIIIYSPKIWICECDFCQACINGFILVRI